MRVNVSNVVPSSVERVNVSNVLPAQCGERVNVSNVLPASVGGGERVNVSYAPPVCERRRSEG